MTDDPVAAKAAIESAENVKKEAWRSAVIDLVKLAAAWKNKDVPSFVREDFRNEQLKAAWVKANSEKPLPDHLYVSALSQVRMICNPNREPDLQRNMIAQGIRTMVFRLQNLKPF
jgi:hypothetical protein